MMDSPSEYSGYYNEFSTWIEGHADVLYNLSQSLPPIVSLLHVLMFVMGLGFAFKAIYSLKAYGEARTMMSTNASMKEPITYLIIASIFVYGETAYSMFTKTIFGYDSPLAYGSLNGGHSSVFDSAAGEPLVAIIQVIGLCAFIRGWVLIGRASGQGQQPGGTGKGFMHVFGGILAMNIVGTLNIINNTLYGT